MIKNQICSILRMHTCCVYTYFIMMGLQTWSKMKKHQSSSNRKYYCYLIYPCHRCYCSHTFLRLLQEDEHLFLSWVTNVNSFLVLDPFCKKPLQLIARTRSITSPGRWISQACSRIGKSVKKPCPVTILVIFVFHSHPFPHLLSSLVFIISNSLQGREYF